MGRNIPFIQKCPKFSNRNTDNLKTNTDCQSRIKQKQNTKPKNTKHKSRIQVVVRPVVCRLLQLPPLPTTLSSDRRLHHSTPPNIIIVIVIIIIIVIIFIVIIVFSWRLDAAPKTNIAKSQAQILFDTLSDTVMREYQFELLHGIIWILNEISYIWGGSNFILPSPKYSAGAEDRLTSVSVNAKGSHPSKIIGGRGGHRFMKVFHKIPVFLKDGFPNWRTLPSN